MHVFVWLTAAAIAVWAHRSSWTRDPRSTRPLLLVFGVTFLAWRVSDLVLARTGARLMPPAAVVLEAVFGLVLWTATIALVSFDTRRRDLWLRVPLLLIGLGIGLSGGDPTFPTMLAVLSHRWRAHLSTRTALGIAVLGVALLLFAWIGQRPPGQDPGAAPPIAALAIFQGFAFVVGTIYLLFGADPLTPLLKDPTLGIRRVARRLALSHVLVVGVPLVLTVMLWMATTLFGVAADRTGVARRAIVAENDALAASIAAATAADPGPKALALWAGQQSKRWPGVRVVTLADTTFTTTAGEPLADPRPLAAWTAALDTVPGASLIVLADSMHMAAVVRGPGPSRAWVFALVPGASVASGAPATIAQADLRILGAPPRDTVRVSLTGGARSTDSTRNGVTISTGNSTFKTSERGADAFAEVTRGHDLLPSLTLTRNGVARSEVLLSATIAPRQVWGGLFAHRNDSELSALPLVLVLTLAVMLALVAVFAFFMVTRMGLSITTAIHTLRTGAEKLRAGELSHRVTVAGDDELWEVAGVFNQAAADLEKARASERERVRLESELALARQIQARLLPTGTPAFEGLEIAGLSRSAREVGGDYYDHIALEDGRVLLVIADVSGKGAPAALLMSGFRASLMSQDLARHDLQEVATRLNGFVVRSVEMGRFVTAFLAVVDGRTGEIEYVNAGHNPPLVVRTGGVSEPLEVGGLIFGIMADATYERGLSRLDPGDRLVLYTDGVTEGADATGEQWGEDRLLGVVRENGVSCRVLAERIADRVRAFEGDQGPADDVTLLVARRAP